MLTEAERIFLIELVEMNNEMCENRLADDLDDNDKAEIANELQANANILEKLREQDDLVAMDADHIVACIGLLKGYHDWVKENAYDVGEMTHEVWHDHTAAIHLLIGHFESGIVTEGMMELYEVYKEAYMEEAVLIIDMEDTEGL